MEENYLSKEEVVEALSHYDLGDIISYTEIPRNEHLQPAYELETTSGRYFIKQYWRFEDTTEATLRLLLFLNSVRYPAVVLIPSKEKTGYVEVCGKKLSIFEWIDFPESDSFTAAEASELGRNLGRLHAITKDFDYPKSTESIVESFGELYEKQKHFLVNEPERIKSIYKFVGETISQLKAVCSEFPQSFCHCELTMAHSRFIDHKLVKIVDWEGKYSSMLLDLGTTMMEAFKDNQLNFEYLNAMLEGYNAERLLESVERKNLYYALVFGVSKFLLWELKGGVISKHDFYHMGLLMDMGKREFDERFGEYKAN